MSMPPPAETLAGRPPRAEAAPADAPRMRAPWVARPGTIWALVGLLAVATSITVLGVGFLADDFPLLARARASGIDLHGLLPGPDPTFYRPVGVLLIFQLGWLVWGFHPLPYHLLSLALHTGTALGLGLWLAEASGRRGLGALAGALFAVFPLHLEAVAWVGAAYDPLATCCAMFSLWLFTAWWRPGGQGWGRYLLAWAGYGLGLFSKESLLAFLPIYALAAWVVTPGLRGPAGRRLALALLPFAAVLGLNVALRLLSWGTLGGYHGLRTDYGAFFWDRLLDYGRVLLAPINAAFFGPVLPQVVGAGVGLGWLLGLVGYGRRQGRLLLLAGTWVLLGLLPVLNLPVGPAELLDSRFYYLASAGYCVGAAVLLYAALLTSRRAPWVGSLLIALLLAGSAVVTTVQLGPWRGASAQATALLQEIDRLIPPQPRPSGMTWYVENPPDNYQGAYLFRLGLDAARALRTGDGPLITYVSHAATAPITATGPDGFALRFNYSPHITDYQVDYAAGVTADGPPPDPPPASSSFQVWDFRACAADAVPSWATPSGPAPCLPGRGLILPASSTPPLLRGPALALQPAAGGARFLRLRTAMRYPAGTRSNPPAARWAWTGAEDNWPPTHSRSFAIAPDGASHVYWTFLPSTDLGVRVAGLRLEPADQPSPVEVAWIALDLVP
ncbi:MAG TPA: hypothetical protein VKY74_26570 [Chloroflexia bacterium]|nr:hypothetical protein [Chloroflexia bacterium]